MQFIEIKMLYSFDKPQSLWFVGDKRNLLIFKIFPLPVFFLCLCRGIIISKIKQLKSSLYKSFFVTL